MSGKSVLGLMIGCEKSFILISILNIFHISLECRCKLAFFASEQLKVLIFIQKCENQSQDGCE